MPIQSVVIHHNIALQNDDSFYRIHHNIALQNDDDSFFHN